VTSQESGTSDQDSTTQERRDRWRRAAGTIRWQDETGDRSGAPAPSPS